MAVDQPGAGEEVHAGFGDREPVDTDTGEAATAHAMPPDRAHLLRRTQLIGRFYGEILRRLDRIEGDAKAESGDREARGLSTLVRAFHSLAEAEDKARAILAEHEPDQANDGAVDEDAERWREQLARRIAALGSDRTD